MRPARNLPRSWPPSPRMLAAAGLLVLLVTGYIEAMAQIEREGFAALLRVGA